MPAYKMEYECINLPIRIVLAHEVIKLAVSVSNTLYYNTPRMATANRRNSHSTTMYIYKIGSTASISVSAGARSCILQ